jgi:hypothetical protein
MAGFVNQCLERIGRRDDVALALDDEEHAAAGLAPARRTELRTRDSVDVPIRQDRLGTHQGRGTCGGTAHPNVIGDVRWLGRGRGGDNGKGRARERRANEFPQPSPGKYRRLP